MIVVKVELHSALTKKVTELARMNICNIGVNHTGTQGDYEAATLYGRSTSALDKQTPQRKVLIKHYPRLAIHVWHLVADALNGMGYDKRGKKEKT